MLFSGIPFLYYFLPIVLLLYFLLPKGTKNGFLLTASLLFYGWGEPKYVFLMLATIILFFCYGLAIEKADRLKKVWLVLSVLTGAIFLGIFKYADFSLETINRLTGLGIPLLRLALPIGISFYTFQCISYTVDIYRGQANAQRNPVDFGTYVALFPQLIAGPIVRYVDIAQQLQTRQTSREDFSHGLFLFLIGLGKKVLLANPLGELTELFRSSPDKSVLFYWLYAVAFMLHIYFDFSGYSDMAIGLGRILGFRFPKNFDYPYVSTSVTEFWRRWHMTLGGWFRDYVYIPLGGNRVRPGRWVFNILTVWMLTGLWHGAAWTFVVWGLLFALLLLAEKRLPLLHRLPKAIRHGYVLLTVLVSFVIFNAAGLRQAWEDLGGLLGAGGLPFISTAAVYYLKSYALLLILAIVGATPLVRNAAILLGDKPISHLLMPLAAAVILLVCTAYLVDGSFNPFLYFRF